MDPKEKELKELSAQIGSKIKRTTKFSIIVTMVMVIIATAVFALIIYRDIQRAKRSYEIEVREAVLNILNDYTKSIENEDVEALSKLFYEPTEDFLSGWSTFFKMTQEIGVRVSSSNLKPAEGKATFDVNTRITYVDQRNQIHHSKFSAEWIIQKISDRWIVRATAEKFFNG